MRSFEPGKLPKLGGEVDLNPDDESDPSMSVEVCRSYGLAEIMAVKNEKGQHGIIAFQPDGSWWWIRKIEPREAWQTDPDSWMKPNG